MNNEREIFKDDPWEGIKRDTYPSGRRLYLDDERFWVSRNSLNQMVFYIHDVCPTVIPMVNGLSSVDTIIEQYKNHEQRLVCTFVESSEKTFEKFGLVVKYIAVLTDKFNGVALFTKIQKELLEWSDFLKNNTKQLSQSELIGFWGELYVIKHHIMEHHDIENVIRYWAGPTGAKKDISLNSLAIEVKTSKASGANKITISSLDQLERTTDKLYLMHLFINDADKETGITLLNLYESIRASTQHNISALALFTRRAGNIFNRASPQQKDECFLCAAINMYDVLDGFPKLLRSNLEPMGILDAKYSISIASIQSFNVTENMEDIIKNG
jgi:hypothetical protein